MKTTMTIESAHPTHYQTEDGIECIDAIRAMLGSEGFIAYCRGNIMRYNWRCGKKDEAHVEIEKIGVYQRWILDTMACQPLQKGP